MDPTAARSSALDTNPKSIGTQSIRRTLEIIRVVAANQEKGITLSTIAKKIKCHIVTTHRILSALVEENFLIKISKKYYLGVEFFILGSMGTRYNIANYLQATIDNLASKTGNTTYLLQRVGLSSVCIGMAEGGSHIRIMSYTIGTKIPLGVGAGSLALLAFLDEDEIEKIIAANEIRYKHFDLGIEDIRKNVRLAKKLGFAVSEGTYKKGVTGVSVPVYSSNNHIVAAISIAALASEMKKGRRNEIAELIKSEIMTTNKEVSYLLNNTLPNQNFR